MQANSIGDADLGRAKETDTSKARLQQMQHMPVMGEDI